MEKTYRITERNHKRNDQVDLVKLFKPLSICLFLYCYISQRQCKN